MSYDYEKLVIAKDLERVCSATKQDPKKGEFAKVIRELLYGMTHRSDVTVTLHIEKT
jgi:hypothetical protein